VTDEERMKPGHWFGQCFECFDTVGGRSHWPTWPRRAAAEPLDRGSAAPTTAHCAEPLRRPACSGSVIGISTHSRCSYGWAGGKLTTWTAATERCLSSCGGCTRGGPRACSW